MDEENISKSEIDKIFRKYEKFGTERNAGPQPLTIDQYKERQKNNNNHTHQIEKVTPKKKKKRGGKKVQKRKEIAILYRELHIQSDTKKKEEIKKKIVKVRKLN